MECELCGGRAEGRAEVEGTVISVCGACMKFGKKVHEARPVKLPDRPKHRSPEEVYFVANFSEAVKQAREELSLTREQLAATISEKVSAVERVEKGLRPEKRVAKKLERALGIRLISSADAEKTTAPEASAEPLTLGDIVTVKKKRKK